MAFITDKEVLKSGLIIFRRGDVEHRNFYCRIKLPKEDRYKTISLHTSDRESARDRAFDQDADIRFRVKHDVAVFNRPFRQVAADYLQTQQRRADTGEVSHDRVKNLRNAFKKALEDYVGSTQIHLIGQDSWAGYPTWRRENGKGRFREHISDAAIQFEMGALNAVMNFAITKRLVPASHRFEGRPKLKTMRRDEFTIEEYRKLHSVGRKWIRAATTPQAHFPSTIIDLYDPAKMPDNLRRAHEANDEVLERIYIGRRFKNDTERLEKLFELYTKMTKAKVAA
ncbi:MAG: hypothetical protein CVT85_00015 [Alphaproteobacteria bacterium HGW-Alphaproteobacteria-7]|nr:MAG: hypothetical protein CVT85_00015 [Alphaproteobacteria bacterium HGW-Alphaproteobacteria-7]